MTTEYSFSEKAKIYLAKYHLIILITWVLVIFMTATAIQLESTNLMDWANIIYKATLSTLIFFVLMYTGSDFPPNIKEGDIVAYKNGFTFKEMVITNFKVKKINLELKTILLQSETDQTFKEVKFQDFSGNYVYPDQLV